MTAQRILVVDDDAHIHQVIRLALTKAGFDVLEAGDGGEALKLLGTGPTGSEIWAIADRGDSTNGAPQRAPQETGSVTAIA